jgi:hypothetical protein
LAPGITEIVCELEVINEGKFIAELHVFIDDQGTREITLSVNGIAKALDK